MYTTIAELKDRYGEHRLARLAGDGAAPDPGALQRVIDDVAARIDAYVGVRYRTPLAAVPPVLARIARVLVYAELHGDARPENVARDAEAAVRELRAIAAGDMVLGGAEELTAEAAAVENATAKVSAAPRRFGSDAFTGYKL